MGLLDKAGEMQGGKGAAKKPVKKAKAASKPMAKAAPAKAKVAKSKVKKSKAAIDRSLPEDFVLASKGNRMAAAMINFLWNWGAVVGGVTLNILANAQITMILIAGCIMAAANIVLIPTKWGRNIGQFASRTKYIRFTGKKPIFIHGIFSNTDTLFFLVGLFMGVAMSGIGAAGTGDTNFVMVAFGVLFLLVPVMNYFFRKYTEAKQSFWDYIFGAYLVTHTPTGEETGWAARFERMGDYVEKRQEKAAEKKATKDSAAESEDSED
jgi:hypothetical protein